MTGYFLRGDSAQIQILLVLLLLPAQATLPFATTIQTGEREHSQGLYVALVPLYMRKYARKNLAINKPIEIGIIIEPPRM